MSKNKNTAIVEKVCDAMKKFAEDVSGVIAIKNVTFKDNLVLASGCDNYGCTCISYEKCCGCLLQ